MIIWCSLPTWYLGVEEVVSIRGHHPVRVRLLENLQSQSRQEKAYSLSREVRDVAFGVGLNQVQEMEDAGDNVIAWGLEGAEKHSISLNGEFWNNTRNNK